MRKNLLLFILLSFGLSHGQKMVVNETFIINLGKNTYLKSKIHLEDGSIKDGYILEFQDEPVVKMAIKETLDGFKMLESQSGLQKDFYYFRLDEKGKDEKIFMKDIRKIEIEASKYNSHIIDPYIFEKVKISWAKNDSSMKFHETPTFLPIILSNSKITIYGISFNQVPRFYIRNKGDEYSVLPIKITAFDIFNQENVVKRYFTSFQYLGRNCPTFLNILEDYKNMADENPLTKMQKKGAGKEYLNNLKSIQKSYSEDLKLAKKNLKNDELRDYNELRKFQYMYEVTDFNYNTYFNEVVIQYINSCD